MGNKKKSESFMRYVIYALCGVALVLVALLRWSSLGDMTRYAYLILGVVWAIYGGGRALRLRREQKDEDDT